MKRQNVAKGWREFEGGRSDVHVEIRRGRPSVVTDEIIQKFDENIRADRRLTIGEFFRRWWVSRRGDNMTKRAGGRFLRLWNKKTRSPAH
jgi:hypothetical protein